MRCAGVYMDNDVANGDDDDDDDDCDDHDCDDDMMRITNCEICKISSFA